MALVRVLVLRTPDEADTCKSALEPLAPHLQERAHDVVRLSRRHIACLLLAVSLLQAGVLVCA